MKVESIYFTFLIALLAKYPLMKALFARGLVLLRGSWQLYNTPRPGPPHIDIVAATEAMKKWQDIDRDALQDRVQGGQGHQRGGGDEGIPAGRGRAPGEGITPE